MSGETVWLVGMMGAGKSSVGPELARHLARPFVDCDAEIENRAGLSVAEIFAREGEPGFRRREAALIEELAARPSVVALGGGAIAQPGAAEHLARTGTIVYLRARAETLLSRLGDGVTRPLLAGLSSDQRLARLRALVTKREPAYATAAVVIDTDEISPDAIAAKVAQELSCFGVAAEVSG